MADNNEIVKILIDLQSNVNEVLSKLITSFGELGKATNSVAAGTKVVVDAFAEMERAAADASKADYERLKALEKVEKEAEKFAANQLKEFQKFIAEQNKIGSEIGKGWNKAVITASEQFTKNQEALAKKWEVAWNKAYKANEASSIAYYKNIDKLRADSDQKHQEAIAFSEKAANKIVAAYEKQGLAVKVTYQQMQNFYSEYIKIGKAAAEASVETKLKEVARISAAQKQLTQNVMNSTLGIFGSIGQMSERIQTSFTNAFSAIERGAFGLSLTLASIGTVMVAPLGFAIKSAMDFQAQMKIVEGVTGASVEVMKQLSAAALEVGKTTQFSAVQAGEALKYMAQAGFSAEQALAALPGVTDLARAGVLSLDQASKIAVETLFQFQMSASEMGRVADVLAMGVNQSKASIESMGLALSYSGNMAHIAGMSLEETVAVLGSLQNAGLNASRAGTSVNQMLIKLLDPSREAEKALSRYGITLEDASGKFVGVTEVVAQFENILKQQNVTGQEVIKAYDNLSKGVESTGVAAQVAGDLFAIFGARAGPGMAALINQGSESIRKFNKELKTSEGYAKKVGDIISGSTKVSLETFKNAVSSLATIIGEKFLPILTSMIKSLTLLVQVFADIVSNTGPIIPIFISLAAALGSILVALSPLILGFRYLIVPVFGFWLEMKKVNAELAQFNISSGAAALRFLTLGSAANAASAEVAASSVAAKGAMSIWAIGTMEVKEAFKKMGAGIVAIIGSIVTAITTASAATLALGGAAVALLAAAVVGLYKLKQANDKAVEEVKKRNEERAKAAAEAAAAEEARVNLINQKYQEEINKIDDVAKNKGKLINIEMQIAKANHDTTKLAQLEYDKRMLDLNIYADKERAAIEKKYKEQKGFYAEYQNDLATVDKEVAATRLAITMERLDKERQGEIEKANLVKKFNIEELQHELAKTTSAEEGMSARIQLITLEGEQTLAEKEKQLREQNLTEEQFTKQLAQWKVWITEDTEKKKLRIIQDSVIKEKEEYQKLADQLKSAYTADKDLFTGTLTERQTAIKASYEQEVMDIALFNARKQALLKEELNKGLISYEEYLNRKRQLDAAYEEDRKTAHKDAEEDIAKSSKMILPTLGAITVGYESMADRSISALTRLKLAGSYTGHFVADAFIQGVNRLAGKEYMAPFEAAYNSLEAFGFNAARSIREVFEMTRDAAIEYMNQIKNAIISLREKMEELQDDILTLQDNKLELLKRQQEREIAEYEKTYGILKDKTREYYDGLSLLEEKHALELKQLLDEEKRAKEDTYGTGGSVPNGYSIGGLIGSVKKYATGGKVNALVEPGEFIFDKQAVNIINRVAPNFLELLNMGKLTKAFASIKTFASGGRVSGYGGGDKVPITLNEGQFVLRKEVVKQLENILPGLLGRMDEIQNDDNFKLLTAKYLSNTAKYAGGGGVNVTHSVPSSATKNVSSSAKMGQNAIVVSSPLNIKIDTLDPAAVRRTVDSSLWPYLKEKMRREGILK